MNLEELKGKILTPKNVYRCLTYKMHNGRKNQIFPQTLPGITLIRFWKEILTPVLPERILNSLFETDGRRSRRLSDLMNRTGPWTMTRELEEALVQSLRPEIFAGLVDECSDFLKRNHYVSSIFNSEFHQFAEECASDDTGLSEQIKAFMVGLFRSETRLEGVPGHYQDGYRLAWIALVSLFGGNLKQPDLLALCSMENCSCARLWERRMHIGAGTFVPTVITTRTSLLCRTPLPPEDHVGREQELSRLLTLLEQEGKVLVSGMGGIGKTELVRQAVRILEKRARYSRIAYVQYNGSLAASFRMAFPALAEEDDDAVLRLVRYKLENSNEGDVLLLIDNLDGPETEDPPVSELQTYGCAVIVTSRRQMLSGFRGIHLTPLPMEAAARIFSRHSGQPEETGAEELLALADGHPIALALMGNLCRMRRCTPDQLKAQLEEKGLSGFTLTRDTPAKKLLETLNGIYHENALDESMRRLLALFSTFPVLIWPMERLRPVMADLGSSQLTDELLAEAVYYGWLEEDRSGFFMHPVIAETIRQHRVSWDEYPALLAWIDEYVHTDIKLQPRNDVMRMLLCSGPLIHLAPGSNTEVLLPQLMRISSILPIGYQVLTRALIAHALEIGGNEQKDETRFWLLCCQAFSAEIDRDPARVQDSCEKALRLAPTVNVPPIVMNDVRAAVVAANNCGLMDLAEKLLLATLERAQDCPEKINILLAAAEHYIVHGRQVDKVEKYTAEARSLIERFDLAGTLYDVDLMHQETLICYIARDAKRGLPICAQAIELYTRYLDTDDHPIVGNLCRMAASFCVMLEDTEGARTYFEQAYRIMDPEKRGAGLPAAMIECSYAVFLRTIGENRMAYEMSGKGMKSMQRIMGSNPNTASAMRIHGEACEALGKLAQAINWLKRSAAMWAECTGAENVETARTRLILARTMWEKDCASEALPIMEEAHACLQACLGEDMPEVQRAAELLAQIREAASGQ